MYYGPIQFMTHTSKLSIHDLIYYFILSVLRDITILNENVLRHPKYFYRINLIQIIIILSYTVL